MFCDQFSEIADRIVKQGAHRATIVHLGTSVWNEAHADNDDDVENLLPVKSVLKFRSTVSEKESKMSQPIRGQGGHLSFFQSARKAQT